MHRRTQRLEGRLAFCLRVRTISCCRPQGPKPDGLHAAGSVGKVASMTGLRTANPAIAAAGLLTACGGWNGPEAPATDPPRPPSIVRVIDADTVDVDGTRFRLHGIDAPETRQTCRAMGRTWNCGAAATEALKARAEGMSCAGGETDRFGRTIGTCSAGGIDLNAWLVANGWALAYRQFSDEYVDEEAQARANRLGMHRGQFVDPWDWRRGERLEGSDTFAVVSTSDALDAGAFADRLLAGNATIVHGRWMEHGMFAMTDHVGGESGSVAVSFGSSFGTVPSWHGGATWTGDMVGVDAGTGERVEGDAMIDVDDFADADVDIALTGIVGVNGGTWAALRWENVPLDAGGFRADDDDGGRVEGLFYGPDHGEIGGVFERDRLVGAFGASLLPSGAPTSR